MRTKLDSRFLLMIFAVFLLVILGLTSLPGNASGATTTPVDGVCELLPIAIAQQSLVGVQNGGVISNLTNGIQPGNYGWISWTGKPSQQELLNALKLPGASSGYINPDNSNDHILTVGDWVNANTSVKTDDAALQQALYTLQQRQNIVLPVWSLTRNRNGTTAYWIRAFVQVQLTNYAVNKPNVLSFKFLGYRTCTQTQAKSATGSFPATGLQTALPPAPPGIVVTPIKDPCQPTSTNTAKTPTFQPPNKTQTGGTSSGNAPKQTSTTTPTLSPCGKTAPPSAARAITSLQTAAVNSLGQIVYVSYMNIDETLCSASNIFVMNDDGSNKRQLTECATTANTTPSWSPDGLTIVFARRLLNASAFEIYKMNADGSSVQQLTNRGVASVLPKWSPNGQYIMFTTGSDGNNQIYVMNADGSNPHNITNHQSPNINGTWSPDSQRIVFSSARSGNYEIYIMNDIMNADGSNVQRITDHSGSDTTPAWSPNGQYIVFASNRDGGAGIYGGYGIYIIDATGSELSGTPVQRLTADGYLPSWSPDGTKITFTSTGQTAGIQIVTMDVNGTTATNRQELTSGVYTSEQSAWGVNAAATTPTPSPTPTLNPSACQTFVVMEYGKIYKFANSNQAGIFVNTIRDSENANQINRSNGLNVSELSKIMQYARSANPQLSYLLVDSPNTVVAPATINIRTITSSSAPFEGQVIIPTPIAPTPIPTPTSTPNPYFWFSPSYGLSDVNTPPCGLNVVPILTPIFSTDVFTITDSSGIFIRYQSDLYTTISILRDTPDPYATSMELTSFLDKYVRNLEEYQTAIAICQNDSNPASCRTRIYTRLVIEANNRFDDWIDLAARDHQVPPLLLKTLLMQESNLLPIFDANIAKAYGIAQFTQTGLQELIDKVQIPANTTLADVDGIKTVTANGVKQLAPNCTHVPVVGSYATNETNCVDFNETLNAIEYSSLFLKGYYENYVLRGLLNRPKLTQAFVHITSASQRNELLWILTIAGYNAGSGNLDSALKLAEDNMIGDLPNQPLTFGRICPYLPTETQKYVKRITNGRPGDSTLTGCN